MRMRMELGHERVTWIPVGKFWAPKCSPIYRDIVQKGLAGNNFLHLLIVSATGQEAWQCCRYGIPKS